MEKSNTGGPRPIMEFIGDARMNEFLNSRERLPRCPLLGRRAKIIIPMGSLNPRGMTQVLQ